MNRYLSKVYALDLNTVDLLDLFFPLNGEPNMSSLGYLTWIVPTTTKALAIYLIESPVRVDLYLKLISLVHLGFVSMGPHTFWEAVKHLCSKGDIISIGGKGPAKGITSTSIIPLLVTRPESVEFTFLLESDSVLDPDGKSELLVGPEIIVSQVESVCIPNRFGVEVCCGKHCTGTLVPDSDFNGPITGTVTFVELVIKLLKGRIVVVTDSECAVALILHNLLQIIDGVLVPPVLDLLNVTLSGHI